MFNAASLAVAPPNLRENAPMPCPVEVNNLLSKYTQFRNHTIEWDDSEARVPREHPGLTPGGHADPLLISLVRSQIPLLEARGATVLVHSRQCA
jgi:hypothetical protein